MSSSSSASLSPLIDPPPLWLAASRVSAAITVIEPSISASNQALFAQHQIGSVLIAQCNPRLQAVVAAHYTTAERATLLSRLQTRNYDRYNQEWVPPKLRKRYINRLPQQQPPPDHVFKDVSYVQQQVLRLVREDPARQLTERDFDSLIQQLSAQPNLPPPPPILIDTSSNIEFADGQTPTSATMPRLLPEDNLLNPSRRHTIASRAT